MSEIKIVNLPIVVPVGDYCLNNDQCCLNFDRQDGKPCCLLDLDFMGVDIGLNYDNRGRVLKAQFCKDLT